MAAAARLQKTESDPKVEEPTIKKEDSRYEELTDLSNRIQYTVIPFFSEE